VTIEANLGANAVRLQGDRIQLQQVLLNLTLNAMDAMQDTPPSARILSVSTRQSGGGLELTVADRGQGIAQGAKARLFESLYTTKPHGMGLGLSIVRTIVEAHRGRVAVADREGGGSVFSVWLPTSSMPDVAVVHRPNSDAATATDRVVTRPAVQGGST
jgi:signal transduction histidine kinase